MGSDDRGAEWERVAKEAVRITLNMVANLTPESMGRSENDAIFKGLQDQYGSPRQQENAVVEKLRRDGTLTDPERREEGDVMHEDDDELRDRIKREARVRIPIATRHDGPRPCPDCDGTGQYEGQIGGDGYGGKCAGVADVPLVCNTCDGAGEMKTQTNE